MLVSPPSARPWLGVGAALSALPAAGGCFCAALVLAVVADSDPGAVYEQHRWLGAIVAASAVCAFVALHFELFTSARRTPEIAAELAALHRRIREHVAEQLEAKAREGVIAPTADAESVVTVLLSLADGLALRMLADPGHDWGPTLAAAMPAARALLG